MGSLTCWAASNKIFVQIKTNLCTQGQKSSTITPLFLVTPYENQQKKKKRCILLMICFYHRTQLHTKVCQSKACIGHVELKETEWSHLQAVKLLDSSYNYLTALQLLQPDQGTHQMHVNEERLTFFKESAEFHSKYQYDRPHSHAITCLVMQTLTYLFFGLNLVLLEIYFFLHLIAASSLPQQKAQN